MSELNNHPVTYPPDRTDALLASTTTIVCAMVTRGLVQASGEVAGAVASVHKALSEVTHTIPARPAASIEATNAPASRREPAVPIDQSITDDAIICLEDGRPFKSLKRHLSAKYDLTPEAYRERWGLPSDYPMVAPAYAAARSAMAKELGLGRKPKSETVQ